MPATNPGNTFGKLRRWHAGSQADPSSSKTSQQRGLHLRALMDDLVPSVEMYGRTFLYIWSGMLIRRRYGITPDALQQSTSCTVHEDIFNEIISCGTLLTTSIGGTEYCWRPGAGYG